MTNTRTLSGSLKPFYPGHFSLDIFNKVLKSKLLSNSNEICEIKFVSLFPIGVTFWRKFKEKN